MWESGMSTGFKEGSEWLKDYPAAVQIEWEEKEVLVYKPQPTFAIHMAWFLALLVASAVSWCCGYGPNWFHNVVR